MTSGGSPRWLLLLLQLPTKPVAARMMTWRRLQQLGSVAIKHSVYALPNTPQAREDFEWLRAEVVAANGQASIMTADAVTPEEDDAIRRAFLEQRSAGYDAIVENIDKLLRGLRARSARPARAAAERAVRNARDEVARLDAMELIPADARARALLAIGRLEARLAPQEKNMPVSSPSRSTRETVHARTWVTRPRPGVDRMASAWLIRRFIDPKATFTFAAEVPRGRATKRVPFDMFGVPFGHQGDRCTFEVLCDHFGIDDSRVRHIAKIVHDVDLKDDRYGLPDAPVIARMVEGLRATYPDDGELLAHGMAMFAALYGSIESAPLKTRNRRSKR